jgi:hypothetical protein
MDEDPILRALQGRVFTQKQELVDWVKNYCKEGGVVLTTKTSINFTFGPSGNVGANGVLKGFGVLPFCI